MFLGELFELLAGESGWKLVSESSVVCDHVTSCRTNTGPPALLLCAEDPSHAFLCRLFRS